MDAGPCIMVNSCHPGPPTSQSILRRILKRHEGYMMLLVHFCILGQPAFRFLLFFLLGVQCSFSSSDHSPGISQIRVAHAIQPSSIPLFTVILYLICINILRAKPRNGRSPGTFTFRCNFVSFTENMQSTEVFVSARAVPSSG